ncbi:pyridoxal phosphate-dependent aminotransferase [Novosphingobium rosa]|uniref:pyridoxal phosphate-dependent aminotransferase n=1 Tax=Novosphingobium rosa TaxID=76978 RepID=UPI001C3FC176|nr:pyridoxal phosphate-dependent aminotransferase [Novosphingobium rosa]
MFAKAAAIADRDLIHLELGMPVHDTPDFIKDATIAALKAGDVHYSSFQGQPALRAALAEKITRFNAVPVDAGQVLVTNGLTQASYAAFMATINPGDEVILLDPYYPQHVGKIELCGGKVVLVPLDAENDFALRADWIAAKVTEKTRAVVLVNPCNPTGRIYTREELEALAEVAIRHNLVVISDEVYEYITFDGHAHISIAALPGMAERTITLSAFTKAYAMDGWRIGYAFASAELIGGMSKIVTNEVTHVNTFIQAGALAAVTGGDEAVAHMVGDDRAKRDIVVRAMNQMPGVTCMPPQGTIYAFPCVRETGLSSQELADRILDECGVVVEAGSFYGAAGEGYLRVCFGSQSAERIGEAMERLRGFFSGLKAA